MFSCEFRKISKNAFSYRTPPVAASEHLDLAHAIKSYKILYFAAVPIKQYILTDSLKPQPYGGLSTRKKIQTEVPWKDQFIFVETAGMARFAIKTFYSEMFFVISRTLTLGAKKCKFSWYFSHFRHSHQPEAYWTSSEFLKILNR